MCGSLVASVYNMLLQVQMLDIVLKRTFKVYRYLDFKTYSFNLKVYMENRPFIHTFNKNKILRCIYRIFAAILDRYLSCIYLVNRV